MLWVQRIKGQWGIGLGDYYMCTRSNVFGGKHFITCRLIFITCTYYKCLQNIYACRCTAYTKVLQMLVIYSQTSTELDNKDNQLLWVFFVSLNRSVDTWTFWPMSSTTLPMGWLLGAVFWSATRYSINQPMKLTLISTKQ